MSDTKIKDLADVLNTRILSFQNQLTGSIFKTRASVQKEDCVVGFKRVKDEWKIMVQKGQDIEKHIADCSLNTKMEAIKLFPDLIEAMKDSKKDLENRLVLAIEQMDHLLDGVGNV